MQGIDMVARKFYKRIEEKRARVEDRIIDSRVTQKVPTHIDNSEINDDIYYFIRIEFRCISFILNFLELSEVPLR